MAFLQDVPPLLPTAPDCCPHNPVGAGGGCCLGFVLDCACSNWPRNTGLHTPQPCCQGRYPGEVKGDQSPTASTAGHSCPAAGDAPCQAQTSTGPARAAGSVSGQSQEDAGCLSLLCRGPCPVPSGVQSTLWSCSFQPTDRSAGAPPKGV